MKSSVVQRKIAVNVLTKTYSSLLTVQNFKNTGEWLTNAKLKFSKSNCAAYNLANKYVNGSPYHH